MDLSKLFPAPLPTGGENPFFPAAPDETPAMFERRRQALEGYIRNISGRIFDNWDDLRFSLYKYGSTIYKRWDKKTKQQRRGILLKASPNMPAKHRPDFDAWRKAPRNAFEYELRGRHLPSNTKPPSKEPFICPYINVEDLLEADRLLSFMHARGQHTPHEFVFHDLESMMLGKFVRALTGAELEGYLMDFSTTTTKDTYGKLQKNDGAREFVSEDRMLSTESGIFLLEHQDYVLRTLLECVTQLVHDLFSDEVFIVPVIPILPLPPRRSSESEKWTNVVQLFTEDSYKEPPTVDFARLSRLAVAKRDEAEDQVWALRGDPAYFKAYVAEQAEHHFSSIEWKAGSEAKSDFDKHEFNEDILRMVVEDSYFRYINWDLVCRQLIQTNQVHMDCRAEIAVTGRAPANLVKQLDVLLELTEKHKRTEMGAMKSSLGSSPYLRKHFRLFREDGRYTITWKPNASYKDSRGVEYMVSLISWLVEVGFSTVGHEIILDELERLLQSDRDAASAMTNFCQQGLSNVASIVQIHRSILAMKRQLRISTRPSQKDIPSAKLFNTFEPGVQVLESSDLSLEPLAFPLSKFNYPRDKKRSQANVEQMQTGERNLKSFWDYLDAHCLSLKGKTLNAFAGIEEQKIVTTPDFVEPKDDQTKQAQGMKELTPAFDRFSFGAKSESRDESVDPKGKNVKIKEKTRPAATPNTLRQAPSDTPAEEPEEEANTPQDQSTVDPKKKITVTDRRACRVLESLFAISGSYSKSSEVLWNDFLHLMKMLGFKYKKLHGSAWTFEPLEDSEIGNSRPITFHEPHPSNRLMRHIQWDFGRRLGRVYGWDARSFELVK